MRPIERRRASHATFSADAHPLRSSSGGTTAHGEAPQADQLLPTERSTRIRMIVVSVDGNDLGFASIVTACLEACLTRSALCSHVAPRGPETWC